MKIGKYTKGGFSDKGNVFSVQDISPCLESAMGTGGHHVPTFVEIHSDRGGEKTIMIGILRRRRTEHAKIVRRMYGDYSGKCRFNDCWYYIARDGIANTITSFTKDNLLVIWQTQAEKK